MKKFLRWLVSPVAKDYSDNSGYLYKRTITWISCLTILIVVLILCFISCNTATVILTFLAVAGASTAGGAAIGFLFGLPRSEKYRFIDKNDVDHNAKTYSYSDNTNLEEVSDWLTKIIVGLTLIKLKTIIFWIDSSAHSIENAFQGDCKIHSFSFAYVFGYSIIILYFLAGAGLCYLWARTNLSILLTKSKLAQADLEKKELIAKVQELANPNLTTQPNDSNRERFAANNTIQNVPTEDFKNIVESIYNAKPIIDKTDIQKGRWGGNSKIGDKVLEAMYDYSAFSVVGLFRIKLKVRSLNADNPLTGQVAFFLHDTFPSEIVYAVALNNIAEITITAYEAFVVGVRLEDKTELELDLNKVKGFPDNFYWT